MSYLRRSMLKEATDTDADYGLQEEHDASHDPYSTTPMNAGILVEIRNSDYFISDGSTRKHRKLLKGTCYNDLAITFFSEVTRFIYHYLKTRFIY